jgi:hypothetical protein
MGSVIQAGSVSGAGKALRAWWKASRRRGQAMETSSAGLAPVHGVSHQQPGGSAELNGRAFGALLWRWGWYAVAGPS